MEHNEILKEFTDAESILKGHFILSSGLHSDTYMQCARVLMEPRRSKKLCAELAKRVLYVLKNKKIDLVVSPAMGGVIVGYEMACQLNVPNIFCERVDGKLVLRRGFDIKENSNILIVEDVITTGKSSLETIECIKPYKVNILAEACLVNRSNNINLGLPIISLLDLDIKSYEANNLPESLKNIPAIKPGSRWIK